MLYEELPAFVRESTVLSEEEKIKLTTIDSIPSEMEVDSFRMLSNIQELTNAFIGDESTRNVHLQEKAKEFIAENDILSAWKVILL